jgi:molecular chaperone GrpE
MTDEERSAHGGSLPDSVSAPDVAEVVELLQRERANFRNYKWRVEQDRVQDRERARAEVLMQLLPVLDDLERALAHRPSHLSSDPWSQGLALIHRRLEDILHELGVSRVGTPGEPFDPEIHDAVHYETLPDLSEQRVASVYRPGYRMGDRLLRPAQVAVVGPPTNRATGNSSEPEMHQETDGSADESESNASQGV